jgi:hypothetical protein
MVATRASEVVSSGGFLARGAAILLISFEAITEFEIEASARNPEPLAKLLH